MEYSVLNADDKVYFVYWQSSTNEVTNNITCSE